ncbi:threonine/serine ThrE exporter family protein [Nocardioides ferulae]|uniref:threonine/serine ThrE exporter family protein n=1 Tax=Nocardioides ferulae TaxID=2340821 RepID=UPI000EAE2FF6|nr:threonine/serine exporter family protein [Nocardioides ferulae]
MPEVRETNLTLDFCLRVGELLLSSGAGAADVTATMDSLAYHFGIRRPDIDVTFTSLSMSYQLQPEDPPLVHTRLVRQRDIDYDDLTQVDHLVRDVLAGRFDLKEARSELARVTSSGHSRPRWAVTVGWGLMCAGVGIQLGGDAVVVSIAFVAAVCIDRLQIVLARQRLPFFYRQIAGGAVATGLAVLCSATPLDVDVSLVITANIVMLLAGIGFMGALQDALSGFYVTGTARITEAILATAGIIAGVSAGLTLASALGVEVGRIDPGTGNLKDISIMAVGAALCAAAFAFSSYAPWRIIAPIAVIAAVAMFVSAGIQSLEVGRTWGTGVAAFLVGLVSYTVSARVRVPPLVIVVSAIVPMLPGLSIYRGLALLAESGGESSDGLLAMVTAVTVAIALASGVILGEYVAQPLKREARRLEQRLAGPRLVGPHRAQTRAARRERRARTRETPTRH